MDTPSEDGRLVVYADYVCPFCYLGKRSLERYLDSRESEDEPTVEWHPFDLRRGKRRADGSIDHGVDDGKDEAYFEGAKQNVRRLRERYDVEMAQELAIEVDSLPAQLVSLSVSETHPEQWQAFDDAIYDALWQDGRDIGETDTLLDLAESVGLSSDEIRDVLEDEDHRTRLEEAFTEAAQAGITGVPTFVYDGYAARGAVPPAQLERLVDGA